MTTRRRRRKNEWKRTICMVRKLFWASLPMIKSFKSSKRSFDIAENIGLFCFVGIWTLAYLQGYLLALFLISNPHKSKLIPFCPFSLWSAIVWYGQQATFNKTLWFLAKISFEISKSNWNNIHLWHVFLFALEKKRKKHLLHPLSRLDVVKRQTFGEVFSKKSFSTATKNWHWHWLLTQHWHPVKTKRKSVASDMFLKEMHWIGFWWLFSN